MQNLMPNSDKLEKDNGLGFQEWHASRNLDYKESTHSFYKLLPAPFDGMQQVLQEMTS